MRGWLWGWGESGVRVGGAIVASHERESRQAWGTSARPADRVVPERSKSSDSSSVGADSASTRERTQTSAGRGLET